MPNPVVRDGTTVVVGTGREFEILAENTLDGILDATPVMVGKRMLLRGRHHLWCLGGKQGD